MPVSSSTPQSRRPALPPLHAEAKAAARNWWDGRAKPPGSLGRIEAIGTHLAGVTARCPPPVPGSPAVVVFAGDHGVVADGASAWPQEVTAAMVANMASGGAAVCAFATTVGASLQVVDVGVAADLGGLGGVEHRKVRAGTASLASGPAMTVVQAELAFEVGTEMATERLDYGADLLVAGEMGIGNTTPAACLIATLCDADPVKVVGPGAGLAELAGKVDIVTRAISRAASFGDPFELLAEVGGLELAAMAGFYVKVAESEVPLIADGVISLASLLVADLVQPGTAERCLAGHRSTEPGASVALAHLAATPLLDLDLRLGEGTGAVLAVPLVQAAARAMNDMAALPT